MNDVYDFPVKTIDGREHSLRLYEGKVLLIVNTASRCGFTPQYKGLEALHQRYKDRGLVVLGFPCNQFLSQEPGTEENIKSFCELSFGVSFPLFSKIEVNGEQAHPLFHYLKEALPGFLGSTTIKWNFTKFLVNRQGQPVERFAPNTDPEALAPAIERLLGS